MTYIDDNLQALDLEQAFSQLSEQRRNYLSRFQREGNRRSGAAAYLLLCKGLRELYGITEPPHFSFGPHGKPFLADHPDIHFSLSHCREAAACAIDTCPIGIDIECVRKFSPALLSHTMNPEEIREINEAPNPEVAFIRLWTQKEAAFKLQGTGITDDIRDILAAASHLHFTTVVSPDQRYIYSVCRPQDLRTARLS